MNKNSLDIKPFYIYTNKDKLYIKNINEHTEKLANILFANLSVCSLMFFI